jgi:hypothetical protein
MSHVPPHVPARPPPPIEQNGIAGFPVFWKSVMDDRKISRDHIDSQSVVVPIHGPVSEHGRASKSRSRRDPAWSAGMSASPSVVGERKLSLAIRTSLLCEFRDISGLLQAFDVCHGQTTFGVLCSALLRMPGVEFPEHDPQAWFSRPARFTFKGELYEVSIPYDNIRISPVSTERGLIDMEELLEYVRHNVLRSRVSRYTVR